MFTDEYFERQLENIREIRLSERKFYQKVARAGVHSTNNPERVRVYSNRRSGRMYQCCILHKYPPEELQYNSVLFRSGSCH